MAKYTLNFNAYHNVKWQQIADDLMEYIDLFLRRKTEIDLIKSSSDFSRQELGEMTNRWSNEVEKLEQRISYHQRMFEFKDFSSQASAIEKVPDDLKAEIKTFSRNLARISISHKDELDHWDYLELDEKIALFQNITNEFLSNHYENTIVEVRLEENRGSLTNQETWATSKSRSQIYYDTGYEVENGKGIVITRGFTSYNAPEALSVLCHELWHEVTSITANFEKIKSDGLKTPSEVLKTLNATRAGYISPELSDKISGTFLSYEMQIPELLCNASEAYFKQALRDLNSRSSRRSRD